MSPWIWSAIGAAFTVLTTMGGFVLRLADRINKAETIAGSAGKQANSAVARVIEVEKQLTEHRVAVAKDYVSNDTVRALENRIIAAINTLGDRIDGLIKGQ
jgi:hypothetical protein